MAKTVFVFILMINFSFGQNSMSLTHIDTNQLNLLSKKIETLKDPINIYESGGISSQLYKTRLYLLASILKTKNVVIRDYEISVSQLGQIHLIENRKDAVKRVVDENDLNSVLTGIPNESYAEYINFLVNKFLDSDILIFNKIRSSEIRDARFLREFVSKIYKNKLLDQELYKLFVYERIYVHNLDYKARWNKIKAMFDNSVILPDDFSSRLFKILFEFYSSVNSFEEMKSIESMNLLNDILKNQLFNGKEPTVIFETVKEKTQINNEETNILLTYDKGVLKNYSHRKVNFRYKYNFRTTSNEVIYFSPKYPIQNLQIFSINKNEKWKKKWVESDCFDLIFVLPNYSKKTFYSYGI